MLPPGGLGHAPLSPEVMAQFISDSTRTKAKENLDLVVQECQRLGFAVTSSMAKDALGKLGEIERLPYSWLSSEIHHIQRLLETELAGKCFMYIHPDAAQFLPTVAKPHAFGSEVTRAFPDTEFDIYEACICLGTGRATASVFHLMRALEIGLRVLGKHFDVVIDRTNWGPAIEQLEKLVREMHKDQKWKDQPGVKEKQEFFAQALAHLDLVKAAWRNYTMHSRAKHTEEEARHIHVGVKMFMQRLATRLSQDPNQDAL